MTKPHGRYDFTTGLTATIFGYVDRTITLAHDVECEVDVHCEVSPHGELDVYCTGVFIDGTLLVCGDILATAIRDHIMGKADADLENGGKLFDQVKEAEGLLFIGHPNDPDARWTIGG